MAFPKGERLKFWIELIAALLALSAGGVAWGSADARIEALETAAPPSTPTTIGELRSDVSELKADVRETRDLVRDLCSADPLCRK